MRRNKIKRDQTMSPIHQIRTENILESKSAEDQICLKKGLPIINCECGAEILVLPDVKAMNKAIKIHLAEHRKKGGNTGNNGSTSSEISQLLTQLTLIQMSHQKDA